MTAVALANEVKVEARTIADADLDGMRDVCRCGTYPRIRQAIEPGAAKI
jgi:isoquinoline 1-oxidoreductase subunit alpha